MSSIVERVIPARPTVLSGLIAAQQQYQLTASDQLEVTYLLNTRNPSGLQLEVFTRILKPDGSMQSEAESITLVGDAQTHRHTFGLRDGWLVAASARVTNQNIRVGELWVSAILVTGPAASRVVLAPLFQGFPSRAEVLAWPGSPLEPAFEAPEYPNYGPLTTPLIGAEILFDVPANVQDRALVFRAQLVTNATAANRVVRLGIEQTSGTAGDIWFSAQAPAQTASTTRLYVWSVGTPHDGGLGGSPWIDALPADLKLVAGLRLRTNTTDLQAGDQWSAGRVALAESLVIGDYP